MNPYRTQEWLVLSTTPLHALADVLRCSIQEVHLAADGAAGAWAGGAAGGQPSEPAPGYFCIENRLYPDQRSSLSDDYTRPVLEWAAKHEAELTCSDPLAELSVVPAGMATTFGELKLRLHVPYLFCHQGDCEHHFVFTDLRAMAVDERQIEFPFILLECKRNQSKCQICELFYAEYVTQSSSVEEVRQPYNPCRFCKSCFTALHYKPDGMTPKHDFQFYKFVQDL